MDIRKINTYKSAFDAISKSIEDDNGDTMEVWYARELQNVLGYARWENFVAAINRAIESCKTQNINIHRSVIWMHTDYHLLRIQSKLVRGDNQIIHPGIS